MLPNITFEVLQGGIGTTTNSEDNIALLVAFTSNTTNLPYNTGREYRSLRSVEADNITKSTDDVDAAQVWWHASEFFRINPTGVLHILLLEATGPSLAGLFIPDVTGKLYNYIHSQNGKIKQVAVAYNLASSVTTHIDSLSTTVISVAQSFANALAQDKKWIDVIFLEGSNYEYTNPASAPYLRDPQRLAPNIAVVLGNDFAHAQGIYQGMASVGTVLGMSTNKQLHESFAWTIDKNNLTDVAYAAGDGRWLSAKIRTGVDVSVMDSSDFETLHERGYIFPRAFSNRAGFYWNQSHNIVPTSYDASNIELNQVINKTQRRVYDAMFPFLNRTFSVKANGRIEDSEAAEVELAIKKALGEMAENYSSLKMVLVDPEKNAAGVAFPSFLTDKTLRAVVGIVPKGKAETIFITIGYTPPN